MPSSAAASGTSHVMRFIIASLSSLFLQPCPIVSRLPAFRQAGKVPAD
jgi:hypothetical protein